MERPYPPRIPKTLALYDGLCLSAFNIGGGEREFVAFGSRLMKSKTPGFPAILTRGKTCPSDRRLSRVCRLHMPETALLFQFGELRQLAFANIESTMLALIPSNPSIITLPWNVDLLLTIDPPLTQLIDDACR